jgi:hypothetical protein
MAGNTDYTRGEMDISEQTSTYNLVMGLTKWGSLATAVMLLWLTLMFCTSAGFMGSTAASVIALAIGIVLLREKPAAAAH